VRREDEKRLQEEARVRQAAIVEEQQKEAEVQRVRAQAEARKRQRRSVPPKLLNSSLKDRIHDRIHSKASYPWSPDNAREYIIHDSRWEVLNVKLRKSSGIPAYDAAISVPLTWPLHCLSRAIPLCFSNCVNSNCYFGRTDARQGTVVRMACQFLLSRAR
jgi:hypothetical protein